MNDLAKNLLLWVVIAVVLMSVFSSFQQSSSSRTPLQYSEFLDKVEQGAVSSVTLQG